jgi:putative Ca2+/H+ antiporter (TMEM165/GDT1 family)
MVIAVTAGQLLTLLPHHAVDGVVAVLFVGGAAYLWVTSYRPQYHEEKDAARMGAPRASFWRVTASSFTIIFLAEWGDITQLASANLAARYNPVLVFAGATLGLWAAAALAVNIGAKSLNIIPLAWVSRITGTILLALGIYSAVAAIS